MIIYSQFRLYVLRVPDNSYSFLRAAGPLLGHDAPENCGANIDFDLLNEGVHFRSICVNS